MMLMMLARRLPLLLQCLVVVVLVGHLVYTTFSAGATKNNFSFRDLYYQSSSDADSSARVSITAQEIVERSFAETYAHLVKHCHDKGKLMKECMKEVYLLSKYRSSISTNSTYSFPLWFHTILRDGSDAEGTKHFLFGPWHNLETNNPDLRMCTIEKVATTQWRAVFVPANGGSVGRGAARQSFAFKPTNISNRPPPDAPKLVFLRDPLERFLSAFINKCEDYVKTGHCEPSAIFKNQTMHNSMLRGILGDKQRLFDAYVDTVPLSWNVHFFPQALYCNGLYRFIDEYDFVGHMDKSRFMDDLDQVGKRYGSQFYKYVRASFRLEEKQKQQQQLSDKEDFAGGRHSTSSSSHVLEYYTPRTLRKVLEYVSVDYMLLRLDIPAWANEMLLHEESGQAARV